MPRHARANPILFGIRESSGGGIHEPAVIFPTTQTQRRDRHIQSGLTECPGKKWGKLSSFTSMRKYAALVLLHDD